MQAEVGTEKVTRVIGGTGRGERPDAFDAVRSMATPLFGSDRSPSSTYSDRHDSSRSPAGLVAVTVDELVLHADVVCRQASYFDRLCAIDSTLGIMALSSTVLQEN